MKKNTLIYILLGIGIGVAAYFLLRKKPEEKQNGGGTIIKTPLSSSYIPVSISGSMPTPSETSML